MHKLSKRILFSSSCLHFIYLTSGLFISSPSCLFHIRLLYLTSISLISVDYALFTSSMVGIGWVGAGMSRCRHEWVHADAGR
jgi:hypothetical protein